VLLRDGRFSVSTVQLDGTQVNGLVVAQPMIDANGLVDITVTVEFGPLDVDPSQFDALAAEIERPSTTDPGVSHPYHTDRYCGYGWSDDRQRHNRS
jgi:hypothetical protein